MIALTALTLGAALALSATGTTAGPTVAPAEAEVPQVRAPGLAQDQAAPNAAKKKRKVIRLDAITVEGRIQKPQAFYILQRANLNYEELNRTESFIPKVEKTVENDPF